ncbi:MAG: cbb3-type cytochrome c oxidase subunit I, partial [Methanosarcinales archaeon]|nr:cbb3-type cytochrome c oxidase subunit I [Methanosarcinales archaeon]
METGMYESEVSTLRTALVSYVVVFVMKLGVYIITGVMALFAEALHTLSDIFISGFLLVSLMWSRKEADEVHMFGYGRAQNVAALVAATLFISFTSYTLYKDLIVGATVGNLLGAGVWGFIHTLPQINMFTHGTQITASHAHFATPGTYLFLVLGMAYLIVPEITGRVDFPQFRGKTGFWLMVLGFANMILALLIAGIVQVYFQRLHTESFMTVQNMLHPFYAWRTFGAIITII